MLPYLDNEPLWREIEVAFATDLSPLTFYGHVPHERLLGKPVRAFACPADARVPGPAARVLTLVAFTSYLGVEGTNLNTDDGLLYLDSRTRLDQVSDGTSNTLLVGERPPSADLRFGWWYRGWGQARRGSAEMILGAAELNVQERGCLSGPYSYGPGRFDNQCDMFHFWSPHPGGAHFGFADGSVRFLRYDAAGILPALATRAGGESVSLPD